MSDAAEQLKAETQEPYVFRKSEYELDSHCVTRGETSKLVVELRWRPGTLRTAGPVCDAREWDHFFNEVAFDESPSASNQLVSQILKLKLLSSSWAKPAELWIKVPAEVNLDSKLVYLIRYHKGTFVHAETGLDQVRRAALNEGIYRAIQ